MIRKNHKKQRDKKNIKSCKKSKKKAEYKEIHLKINQLHQLLKHSLNQKNNNQVNIKRKKNLHGRTQKKRKKNHNKSKLMIFWIILTRTMKANSKIICLTKK